MRFKRPFWLDLYLHKLDLHIQERNKFQPVFAWFPVLDKDGYTWVWLERTHRERVTDSKGVSRWKYDKSYSDHAARQKYLNGIWKSE